MTATTATISRLNHSTIQVEFSNTNLFGTDNAPQIEWTSTGSPFWSQGRNPDLVRLTQALAVGMHRVVGFEQYCHWNIIPSITGRPIRPADFSLIRGQLERLFGPRLIIT